MKLRDLFDFSLLGTDILSYKLFKKERPFILSWCLTNRCNLDCSYCGLPGLTTPELSSKELFDYLDSSIESGLRVLSLTGGEPLVHPDFDKFVLKARSNGVLISVNSNGLLVPNKIDLLKENCFQVVISIDGSRDINDLYRGAGSFEKALKAIKLLQEKGIKTHANCVFTQENYNKLGDILAFAKYENIPFSFQPVADFKLTYEPFEKALTIQKVLEAVDFMIDEKKKGNKFLVNTLSSLEYWKSLYTSKQHVRCFAGKLFARVEVNGDLKKCGRVQDVIPYTKVKELGLLKTFQDLSNFDECTTCEAWSAFNSNNFL